MACKSHVLFQNRHISGKLFINSQPDLVKQNFENQLITLGANSNPRLNALRYTCLRIYDCYFNMGQYDEAARSTNLAKELFTHSHSSMNRIDFVQALCRQTKIFMIKGAEFEDNKYLKEARNVVYDFEDCDPN